MDIAEYIHTHIDERRIEVPESLGLQLSEVVLLTAESVEGEVATWVLGRQGCCEDLLFTVPYVTENYSRDHVERCAAACALRWHEDAFVNELCERGRRWKIRVPSKELVEGLALRDSEASVRVRAIVWILSHPDFSIPVSKNFSARLPDSVEKQEVNARCPGVHEMPLHRYVQWFGLLVHLARRQALRERLLLADKRDLEEDRKGRRHFPKMPEGVILGNDNGTFGLLENVMGKRSKRSIKVLHSPDHATGERLDLDGHTRCRFRIVPPHRLGEIPMSAHARLKAIPVARAQIANFPDMVLADPEHVK